MHGRAVVSLVVGLVAWLPADAQTFAIDAHAFPSVGGFASSSTYSIGCSAGLPIAGAASSATIDALFGFWFPTGPPTVPVDEPPPAPLPWVSMLGHVHPNPFTASTTLRFQVGERIRDARHVRVEIFDVGGRSVRVLVDGALSPGHYTAHWDRKDRRSRRVSSGVYFARLAAGDVVQSTRLVVTQ